ncbi:hypothetical protein PVAP13_8KG167700 [Panicum virgatum]|uniref:Uncharacterized protein n=1 Tax=Panicum virgatum TaxID=38727 RepID=A0A8T0PJ25_PANVG|nr:hypothetical protein PVAP13_8KG167700 [Panicum virgatum]
MPHHPPKPRNAALILPAHPAPHPPTDGASSSRAARCRTLIATPLSSRRARLPHPPPVGVPLPTASLEIDPWGPLLPLLSSRRCFPRDDGAPLLPMPLPRSCSAPSSRQPSIRPTGIPSWRRRCILLMPHPPPVGVP